VIVETAAPAGSVETLDAVATPGSGRRHRGGSWGLSAVVAATAVLIAWPRLPGEVGARGAAVDVGFVSLVAESLPFLVAGALIASLLRGGAVRRLVQAASRRPRLAAGLAPLSGLALPLCDCGIVPLARRLRDEDVAGPAVNSFVAGAPLLNPIVIVSTALAFPHSPRLVAGRMAVGLAVAFVAAALAPQPGRPAVSAAPVHDHDDHGHDHDDDTADSRGPVSAVVAELTRTAPLLVLGALAAAVLKTFTPVGTLLSLARQPLVGAGALMVLAFVMSICSQADAFVAATFPVGPLPRLAFLVLGPVLDLKLATLYRREFGTRWLVGYAAVIVVAVLALTTAWTTWVGG